METGKRRTRDLRTSSISASFAAAEQTAHGPGAVRVLIYRLCNCRERVQSTVRGHLRTGSAAEFPENLCPGCAPSGSWRRPKSPALNTNLVGGPGFEPGASRSRTVRAAKLRQPPTLRHARQSRASGRDNRF